MHRLFEVTARRRAPVSLGLPSYGDEIRRGGQSDLTILDPRGQPPVLQLLAARSWEFLSPPNCAVEVFVHARRHGLIVLIGNVFAYHLRVQEALTANAAMPLVACEDVRTPLGAFRVVFGIGHRLNNRSVMSRRKKKPRRSGAKYRGNGRKKRVLPQQGNLRSGKWFQ
jgi:hypothetical protein